MTEYIEREVAVCIALGAAQLGNTAFSDRFEIAARIRKIPAADARPVVRGKWIDRDDDYYGWNMWECSACGAEFVLMEGTPNMNDYHYCPNCGADMRR